jgi:predicted dehydrogenase
VDRRTERRDSPGSQSAKLASSEPPTRAAIIGAGARGNRVFAELMSIHVLGWEVTAVVEPHPGRREAFRIRHGLPEERAFATLDAFLQHRKVADVAFICTPDVTHYRICQQLSAAGYDVLLEKPIATSLPDCLALLDVQKTYRNQIFVAHVLRYSPFFRTLKEIVASRHFGLVRNLRLAENIGHWHFAHSYVRGSWRRRDESAPIILTKCSHDLDLLAWLMEEDRPAFVSSFGTLEYFTEKNAPAEAADRCVVCPLEDTCRYSATRFYLTEEDAWPYNVIAPPPDSMERRREALETGPYGRCVWKCDNDVCDNQTVNIQFESGIHASFGLYALTADNTRRITVLTDEAEIAGDLRRGRLRIAPLSGRMEVVEQQVVPLPPSDDHHGGGDLALLRTLREHLTTGAHQHVMSSLESSIASHVLAFLADESRLKGGTPLPVPAIFETAGLGGLPIDQGPDTAASG